MPHLLTTKIEEIMLIGSTKGFHPFGRMHFPPLKLTKLSSMVIKTNEEDKNKKTIEIKRKRPRSLKNQYIPKKVSRVEDL